MNAYPFSLLTPDKIHYCGNVVSIIVSGEDGQLTVLAQHAPMVALLTSGPITIRTEKETLTGQTGTGILQTTHEKATALVYTFHRDGDERPEEATEGTAQEHDLLI